MRYFLCLLLILTIQLAFSQEKISFEHLTIEDGLANNSVRTMFQDQQGYMWFGTLNGLSRYDGQQFKTFDYDIEDSTSISNNKIRDIFQDGAGYIWVATYDENAHRFDPKTETFVNYPSVFDEQLEYDEIHFIYESSPGVVWLYITGEGCARIISDPNSEDYELDFFNEDNLLPSNALMFIQKGENGGVWFGTSHGLCYLPDDRYELTDPPIYKHYLTDPSYEISALLESENRAWVGCTTGELFKIEDDQEELAWKTPEIGEGRSNITFIEKSRFGEVCVFSLKGILLIDEETEEQDYYWNRNSDLITSYISSGYKDEHGDFWLVTSRRGVTRFQVEERRFTNYPLNPEVRQSIMEGEKQIFYEDANGDLWVGIYGGGISRFNRSSEKFEQYLHDDDNPESLSSNLVLSLYGDRSGNIWVGTYKRGADKVNLRKTNFNTLQINESGDKDFSNEIRAIFEDSRQWIWTGNKRGDVVVFDQDMQELFALNDVLNDITISSGVYAFEEDHDRQMWIGTKGSGLYVIKNLPDQASKINDRKLEVVHLNSDSNDPNSLANNAVFDLHEDPENQMWVALYHGGVNVIKNPLQADQEFLIYQNNEEDRFSISDNRIRCLTQDSEGNMWIGTAQGLNFLDYKYLITDDKKFHTIERSEQDGGLAHSDIICIFEDSQGNIWIGTYGGGLNKYIPGENPKNQFRFDAIQQEQGLSSNLILSIAEDENQILWVGTDFGLNKYNRFEETFESYYVADGLAENAFSEGNSIETTSGKLIFGHISGMVWFDPDSIKKSHQQAPVVLTDLKINGKADQESLNRARQIIGDSLKSLHLKYDENFLTFEFAALDYKAPSKIQYAFKLEEYEQDWNRSGNLNTAIYRELHPGDYQFKLRASNSDGLWVNPEMKLSITIAPPPWRTIWAYLVYALFLVGLFLLIRRFTLERIKLKHEVEFEKQLTDDKLKFYTSISHEFKTPLALILGPVEDLLANHDLAPAVAAPLKMVKRNTRRLLELIDQLMDFRKIQKGFFQLNKVKADPVAFLSDVYQAFLPVAERQSITFSYKHEDEKLIALFDYKVLEKIVFNLLSNAFKHTEAGKSITLELTSNRKYRELLISVTDEGEGIHEKDLPHLFDRFNLVGRSQWKDQSSTGIGLSLCKELVDLLGGDIFVESERGKGSSFKISFPDVLVSPDSLTAVHPYEDLNYTSQFIDVIKEKGDQLGQSVRKAQRPDNEKILVVEDNPDLQVFLVEHFSKRYKVFQAFNGKEGVQLAREKNPDLIICDVMMPEMDGLQLTEILKSEFYTSHIPIILLTAKSLEEHKIEGIEIGADDYITKPFNMVYLAKRVENILKQRKQLRERFGKDTSVEVKELSNSKADQEFMDKVIRLVEENMTDPEFSVEMMLPHFGFGRTVFYKKMKGISGYSPKDFIRIVRMKKAGELLLDKNVTIAEVAFDVGYNDPEYFSRIFKKHFGLNPSAYQKEKQKQ